MSDDRKYRQRGYQDEPKARGPKGPSAPRPPQERAPGRVLQDAAGPKTPNLMAAHEVCRCARCGNLLSLPFADDARCAALRRRSAQLRAVRLVRHQRPLGMHAERRAAGARRAEGRAQHLLAVHAATTVERQTGTPASSGGASSGTSSARQAFDDLFK